MWNYLYPLYERFLYKWTVEPFLSYEQLFHTVYYTLTVPFVMNALFNKFRELRWKRNLYKHYQQMEELRNERLQAALLSSSEESESEESESENETERANERTTTNEKQKIVERQPHRQQTHLFFRKVWSDSSVLSSMKNLLSYDDRVDDLAEEARLLR